MNERSRRLYEAKALREEAEKDAEAEWPELKETILVVANSGKTELAWGVPAYSEKEKMHYYVHHMMDILKEHGFSIQGPVDGNSAILVSW